MNQDRASEIIDRYKRGQSMSFIAFALEVAPQTIRALLVEAGVPLRKPGRSPLNRNWGWTGRGER